MSGHHGLSDKSLMALRRVFARHTELEQAILFGSRAKGTCRKGSDIDLALRGRDLTRQTVNRLYEELDDLPLPYEFSLVLESQITDSEVLAHIDRVGVVFYEKDRS